RDFFVRLQPEIGICRREILRTRTQLRQRRSVESLSIRSQDERNSHMLSSLSQQRSKPASKSLRKNRLRIEPLEDRCVPSAAWPLDLDAGLDGASLLSDPLFASDQGHKNSTALLAALAGASNPAANAATPVTGSTLSSSAPSFVGKSVTSGA